MKLLIALIMLSLFGCTAMEILGVLGDPDPTPICDSDSAGTVWSGKTCLKYSDGIYRWTEVKP